MADLILEADVIPDDKWWEAPGMLGPPFMGNHMSIAEGFFAGCQGVLPGIVWFVSSRQYWDEISDGSAEDHHGRGEFGGGVWRITVLEDGSL